MIRDEIKQLYMAHADKRVLLYDNHTGINEWNDKLIKGIIVKMHKVIDAMAS